MPLPASGIISLSQINTELSRPATQAIDFNDAAVRTLAGVLSGPISLANFYGKSATPIQVITFDNSGGAYGAPLNWNLWNILTTYGISIQSSKVHIILKNIIMKASSTGVPALETGSGWPTGTSLTVELQGGCAVYGAGGGGGAGSLGQTGAGAGGVGGIAYRVTAAIAGGTITTQLSGGGVYGGGGGGGGGGGIRYYIDTTENGRNYYDRLGGNGGAGAGNGGGAAGGSAGQTSSSGSFYAAAGGTGGYYGAAGGGGGGAYSNYGTYYSAGGGGAGYAIVNAGLSTNINWVAGSNYLGLVA
jgi:hypothetical protein